VQLKGVNLAGAEFGESKLPGVYGTDFIYPTAASVTYFKNKGMNIVRLPFRWERLQPTLNTAFDGSELARLDAFVESVTATGVYVLIDPHNYARYRGDLIGSTKVPNSAFADFWSRLATRYKNNPKVILGLMNEPHDMPTEQWLNGANAALAAIRSAGATNLVTIPGNGYTGADGWTKNWYGTSNSITMKGIVDPGKNFIFEVHQYLDSDGSGKSPDCVSTTIGVERLQNFTAWLKTNGYKALLGEFAGGNNATCNQAIKGMLEHMETNKDVWSGWTWWAAGPWWGNYIYSIEPSGNTDKPQMAVLQPYLP
jgi:endoglucanase